MLSVMPPDIFNFVFVLSSALKPFQSFVRVADSSDRGRYPWSQASYYTQGGAWEAEQ